MEKASQSSLTGDSSTTGKDQYLKHLNKLSHKISKPTFLKKPSFIQNHNLPQPPLPPPQPESSQLQPPPPPPQQPPQHHQPPVYNINKNDFRDVVQKLTGSPAHDRFSNPPPIHPPKPQSSRLQRIRPPPLSHVSNRPPPPFPIPPPSLNPRNNHFNPIGRPLTPLSPLPPLPSVHAPAESPVSAYMRYIHNSLSSVDYNQKQFSGFSPTPQGTVASSELSASMPSELQFPMLPLSPLPFGCMNSPRSAYPLLSPTTGSLGYPQFPLSPTVPVPSPRWRGI